MSKTEKMSEAVILEKEILELKKGFDNLNHKDYTYDYEIIIKNVGSNQVDIKNLIYKLNNQWITKELIFDLIKSFIEAKEVKLKNLLLFIKEDLLNDD